MAQDLALVSNDGTTVLKRVTRGDAFSYLERSLAEAKGVAFYLPLIRRGAAPAYDPETHHAPQQTEVIGVTEVTQGWDAPVAKTQTELDAELDAMVAQMDQNRSFTKGLARIVFKIARGDWSIPQPGLTVAQFKNQIKLASEE